MSPALGVTHTQSLFAGLAREFQNLTSAYPLELLDHPFVEDSKDCYTAPGSCALGSPDAKLCIVGNLRDAHPEEHITVIKSLSGTHIALNVAKCATLTDAIEAYVKSHVVFSEMDGLS